MKQVPIILAQMSKMLFDILSHIVASGFDLESAVRRTRPDVLVLLADRPDATAPLPLLYGYLLLRVLAITSNGCSGTLHELRLRTVPLPELSALALQVALADSVEGKLN